MTATSSAPAADKAEAAGASEEAALLAPPHSSRPPPACLLRVETCPLSAPTHPPSRDPGIASGTTSRCLANKSPRAFASIFRLDRWIGSSDG